MILDAGFLVSIDRSDRAAHEFLSAARSRAAVLRTTDPVVAQVWRDGSRQARLAAFLKSVETVALDEGRFVGQLLAASKTSDVVDAHVVAVALRAGDSILTGDVDDLAKIAATLGPSAPKIHSWPPPSGIRTLSP